MNMLQVCRRISHCLICFENLIIYPFHNLNEKPRKSHTATESIKFLLYPGLPRSYIRANFIEHLTHWRLKQMVDISQAKYAHTFIISLGGNLTLYFRLYNGSFLGAVIECAKGVVEYPTSDETVYGSITPYQQKGTSDTIKYIIKKRLYQRLRNIGLQCGVFMTGNALYTDVFPNTSCVSKGVI